MRELAMSELEMIVGGEVIQGPSLPPSSSNSGGVKISTGSVTAGDPIPQFKAPVASKSPETVGGPGVKATSGNVTVGVGVGGSKNVAIGGTVKF